MLGFTYGEKLIEKFLYDGVVDMCYIAGGISLIRKQEKWHGLFLGGVDGEE